MEDKFMLANANTIPILQEMGSHFSQLLSIDKRPIGAALISQDIVTILIANGGMTTRGQLVAQERNIAGRRTTDTYFKLLERIFIQDFSSI
jgi:hypothetical protein